VLAAALITAGNAIVRRVFDRSSNGLLEVQTLQRQEYVRIDVVAGHYGERMLHGKCSCSRLKIVPAKF
jgi:TRAP-type mannitol/chloroaromatic compound transport system permease small subunit